MTLLANASASRIGTVTGRPPAPSPGDHKDRPYYATASQAGACMVAKEHFFPFTRKFHAMCHSPAVIHALSGTRAHEKGFGFIRTSAPNQEIY